MGENYRRRKSGNDECGAERSRTVPIAVSRCDVRVTIVFLYTIVFSLRFISFTVIIVVAISCLLVMIAVHSIYYCYPFMTMGLRTCIPTRRQASMRQQQRTLTSAWQSSPMIVDDQSDEEEETTYGSSSSVPTTGMMVLFLCYMDIVPSPCL